MLPPSVHVQDAVVSRMSELVHVELATHLRKYKAPVEDLKMARHRAGVTFRATPARIVAMSCLKRRSRVRITAP